MRPLGRLPQVSWCHVSAVAWALAVCALALLSGCDGPDEECAVFLTDIDVTSGALDPPFSGCGSNYEVVVRDATVKELTITMNLDLGKYDKAELPHMFIDGTKVAYNPLSSVHFAYRVRLNETIGSVDRVVRLKVADPAERQWWQLVWHKREHEYTIRVMQPPDIKRVVLGQGVTVTGGDGAVILSRPAFSPHDVEYEFALSQGQTSVTVNLRCSEWATGVVYDGVAAKKGTSKTVPVSGSDNEVVASCFYHNPKWSPGRFEHHYIFSFFHSVSHKSLHAEKLSLHTLPSDGECAMKGMKFQCRVAVEKPRILAMYDNKEARVSLVHLRTKTPIILDSAIPKRLYLPRGEQEYTLRMELGTKIREHPTRIYWPAWCLTLRQGPSGKHCPEGQLLKKSDARRDHLCLETTCTKDDIPHCCAQAATCAAFNLTCPAKTVLRPDAGHIYCHDVQCTEVDAHRCCGRRPRCSSLGRCSAATVLRKDAHRIRCSGVECTHEDVPRCCSQKARCSSLGPCPEGSSLRADASHVRCKGLECAGDDVHLCCTRKASCATLALACPKNTVLRKDAMRIMCKGLNCTEEDLALCCPALDTCSTLDLPCPANTKLRKDGANMRCKGLECTEEDLPHCCAQTANCSGLRHCPEGMTLRRDAAHIRCRGLDCTQEDAPHCCSERARCSSLSIPCPSSMMLRHHAESVLCKGLACTEEDLPHCCAERATCSELHLPCSEGMVRREDLDTISCHGLECTADDVARCCRRGENRTIYVFGQVKRINGDGTYVIQYDFGEVDEHVPKWAVAGVFDHYGGHLKQGDVAVNDRAEARVSNKTAEILMRHRHIAVLGIGAREKLRHYAAVGCSPEPKECRPPLNGARSVPSTPQAIPGLELYNVTANPDRKHLCFYDTACAGNATASTSKGCNADGIHPRCRWCGFDDFNPCPMVPDCSSGFGHPELWTDEKKKFCCERYTVGCPFHCRLNDAYYHAEQQIAQWSDAHRDWCCRHQDLACRPEASLLEAATAAKRPARAPPAPVAGHGALGACAMAGLAALLLAAALHGLRRQSARSAMMLLPEKRMIALE